MPSIHDVAIIIPVYAWKSEHLNMLERCLDSIVGQSGETIVWSDGSNNALSEQFHRIRDSHRWAKFVFSGHNGKSVSRNSAVRLTMREFIYPLDADDELMPGTIETLLDEWDGTPLYSDLLKVHEGKTAEPFTLTDFSCEGNLLKCLSPVNVLHLKEQWEFVGGWNDSVNLFEDWEYNARLFWHFGARRIPRPLVRYHIHPDQHTMRASGRQKHQAMMWVKDTLKEYARRNEMAGCCGKKRTANPSSTRGVLRAPVARVLTAKKIVRTVDLTLTTDLDRMGDPGPGKSWAKYFGGRGMGPHDRRGTSSRSKYLRIQYGGVYAVKTPDTVSREEFESGRTGCEFVRMDAVVVPPSPTPAAPTPVPTQAPAPEEKRPEIHRTPVKVERMPLTSEVLTTYVQSMESMTVKELKAVLDSVAFGPDEIQALLAAEKAAKNRIGATKLLEKYLNKI